MASSVIWNQYCPELNSSNYKVYQTQYATVAFDNGIATKTILEVPTQPYSTALVSIAGTAVYDTTHKYYIRQELNVSRGAYYTGIVGSAWAGYRFIDPNAWTVLSAIGSPASNSPGGSVWVAYCTGTSSYVSVGDVCLVRNPMMVDLTLMFGAGNEPKTAAEFEHQCQINDIDLYIYHPYDTGTEISWRFDVTSESLMTARRKILLNEPHTELISAETANFKTDMVSSLKECKIHFEPLQEGSGDPSPTNVRPIKGYSQVKLKHTGRNVCELYGWSAQNTTDSPLQLYISNSYGTSLSTTNAENSVIITQSQYPTSDRPDTYQNGYLCYVSESLVLDRYYLVSFDVTDITNNPFDIPIDRIQICSPSGSSIVCIKKEESRLIFRYVHKRYVSNPTRNKYRIEIRNCGLSCTFSNFMVTPLDETNSAFEEYLCKENYIIDSPIPGKNIGNVYGYSATTNIRSIYPDSRVYTNSYGTSLSTVDYKLPDTPLVITQSKAPDSTTKTSYRNGYFCIGVSNLVHGVSYKASFKVSNITNNPLDASLTDILLYTPGGGGSNARLVDNDRVVCSFTYYFYKSGTIKDPTRDYIEIRNCGMSFTLSEFMITEIDEADQTYEPYQKTMYGGYLDLVNNEFVQEWECVKMDSSWKWLRYEPYSASNSHYFVQYYANNLPESVAGQHDRTVYSNMFRPLSNINAREYPENNMTVYRSTYAYCFRYDEIGTIEDWKAFLQANDVWVAGKLVTPIHHPLTLQLLKTLRGTNNILTDIPSEVEVKYWTH